jgi:hypothetical protein
MKTVSNGKLMFKLKTTKGRMGFIFLVLKAKAELQEKERIL